MFKFIDTKPATQKTAYSLIRKLAQGESLTNEQISSLLMKFAPKPKSPKNIFEWVSQGVGKRDVRLYANSVYSTGSELIGCNGRILFIAKHDEYEEGFYEPKTKEKLDCSYKYPDIDKIRPLDKDLQFIHAPTITHHFDLSTKEKIVEINGHYYAAKLYEMAMDCPFATLGHHQTDKGLLVLKCNETAYCLIMPLRKSSLNLS